MLFSKRQGLTDAGKLAQIDSMDQDLRNGLWNELLQGYFHKYQSHNFNNTVAVSNLNVLFQRYWMEYFKVPLDEMPRQFADARRVVRNYFFECFWYEVYDLLEFTISKGPGYLEEDFVSHCNEVLERENSGYRLVNGRFTQITSPAEIESIEEAIGTTGGQPGVNAHLRKALEHLADRKNPDYRNSIKESISAVEAMCQAISDNSNATLGDALKVLEERKCLHTALKKSFSALYGYTNDADGIRHAMLEEAQISSVDAKYMLVACSSFVNYLLGKVSELGITMQGRKSRR